MKVAAHSALPGVDKALEQDLMVFAAQTAFTVSCSRSPDMPLVYVSAEFCKMTGYTKQEVLGKNCRFLQGPGTSRHAVQEIRSAIQEDRGCTVCLMNYTKEGKPFWNQLCLAPVCDDGGVAYYLGIQTNVTGAVLAYRSQQFSPFQQSTEAGPHGGVHSFEGCPEIVACEERQAKSLGQTIKRWYSQKAMATGVSQGKDFRPVSCNTLPSSLLTPLYKLSQSFVLADPNLPDMPIVHASEGFLRLTGRPRDKVVGHNCRFMQGQHTDKAEVSRLREAIAEQRPVTVRLLNYTQQGKMFWNNLHVAPIRDSHGKVVFFVGCQLDITYRPNKLQPQGPSLPLKPRTTNRYPASIASSLELAVAPRSNSLPHASSLENMQTMPALNSQEESAAGTKPTAASVPAITGIHHLSPARQGSQDNTEKRAELGNADQGPAAPELDTEHVLRVLGQGKRSENFGGTGALSGGKVQVTSEPSEDELPQPLQELSPSAKQRQRSVIGTVRVVCRSLTTKSGLRRSLEDQHRPHGPEDTVSGPTSGAFVSREPTPGISRLDMPTLNSSHL